MARTGAAENRPRPSDLSAHDEDAFGAACQVVRGYSFYGFSFVYVIFDDGTDIYWARSLSWSTSAP